MLHTFGTYLQLPKQSNDRPSPATEPAPKSSAPAVSTFYEPSSGARIPQRISELWLAAWLSALTLGMVRALSDTLHIPEFP